MIMITDYDYPESVLDTGNSSFTNAYFSACKKSPHL